MTGEVTFYHAPNTRSSDVLRLLLELGAPYKLNALNLKKGEQRSPEYLTINPMGKVPAIVHGGAVVTEVAAIYIYLADAFPQANLAPALSDPLRGPYLRWLVYYSGCLEPALQDYFAKRNPASPASSPYGDYDRVMGTVNAQLAAHPYISGERFTAADLVWCGMLGWMVKSGYIEPSPAMRDYIARVGARPSFAEVIMMDEKLAAT